MTDDRNDLLKRFENTKDKDLRAIIHSQVTDDHLKTYMIKKMELLKPVLEQPVSKIEQPVSKIEQPDTIKSERIE